MKESLQYRDRSLREVKITAESSLHNGNLFAKSLISFNCGSETFEVSCDFGDIYLPDKELVRKMVLEASSTLARCIVLDSSYRSYPVSNRSEPRQIILKDRDRNTNEIPDYLYESNSNSIRILHPLVRRLHIEENRLARHVILHLLYENGPKVPQDIVNSAHFPEKPIGNELDGLHASKYVAHNTQNDLSFLTDEGRRLYESNPAGDDNIVFIIAACHAKDGETNLDEERDHQSVIATYKIFFENSPYRAIFQESEEPLKNIHVDIFDYIDSCAFVIADITYDRPNCYVEIGYALARGKHVIGLMQKEYFDKTRSGDSKIPFDLSVFKFLEYTRGNIKRVEEILKERTGVIQKRRLA